MGERLAGAYPPLSNRLSSESSPYLLQHADNPVAWQPWDEEALARAHAEDKPILLSIGYAACHWCHVMAHESFANKVTAAIINQNFIPIKVDREERPDLDQLYMEATMRMTGSGGWPMTVFLTPDGAPFFAGTYFPPVDRHGVPGFPRLVQALAAWYHDKPDEVREQAQAMRSIYETNTRLRLEVPAELLDGSARLEPALLARAANSDLEEFDSVDGGLKGAPKFPHALGLEFLLRMESRRQQAGAPHDGVIVGLRADLLALVTRTLDKMADGGIHDQIGGGFHRYSTDAIWLIPHFEKMLYDNALLALVYLRAWQVTGAARYREVCEDTLDYILREMTAPNGAFYSSQDADSEGEEGRFYTWSADEFRATLSDADVAVAQLLWGVSEQGNFDGRNILHIARQVSDVAASLGIDEAVARRVVARARERLYASRAQREWPTRDDKAITAWNALTLRALAEAARALDRADYRAAAEKSATFLMTELWREGRLLRAWRQETAKLDAYLEDYAGLANALISVYELTGDAQSLTHARTLADAILDRFWEKDVNGFFDTASDHERLIGRPRELSDNVTPSGTSLACEALLRLTALTGETRYHDIATQAAFAFAPLAQHSPSGFGRMLSVLDDLIGPFYEVALIGQPNDRRLQALRATVERRWRPRTALAVSAPDDSEAQYAAPLLRDRPLVNGAPAAYVCEGFVCQRPITEPDALAALLGD